MWADLQNIFSSGKQAMCRQGVQYATFYVGKKNYILIW